MNISLLGLFIEERQIIKNLFKPETDSNEQIHWVPVTNKELDLLIIRANFLTSIEVKKILNDIDSRVQIISIATTQSAFLSSQSLNIPCINIKENTPIMIEHWLSAHIIQSTHKTNFNTLLNILNQSVKQLTEIQHNEQTFVIDTQTRKIYFNNDRDSYIDLLDNNCIEIIKSSEYNLAFYQFSMDILFWLWKCMLERAEINRSDLPNSTNLLKLIVWPEFIQKLRHTRKEIILLTACLQQNSLTVEELIQQTNVNPTLVYKYCYFMISIGYVHTQSHGIKKINSNVRTTKKGIQYKNILSHLKRFIGLS